MNRRRSYSPKAVQRTAMTLLELIVSMGLLALIMLPVISLLATSYKVMNASNARQDGSYARRTALDAASSLLREGVAVTAIGQNHVEVLFPSGSLGRLDYARGEMSWSVGGVREVVARGLADLQFSVGTSAGARPVAGKLILLEVATRGINEPTDSWSSTQIWIRPAI